MRAGDGWPSGRPIAQTSMRQVAFPPGTRSSSDGNAGETMSRRPATTGSTPSRPIRWDAVPKPGGGLRRLVVLSPEDELAYALSVAGVAPAVRLALGRESHANRVVGLDPARGPILEPWTRARGRWRREALRLGNEVRFIAVTDVRACYPSISPHVLTGQLLALGAPEPAVDQIRRWLRGFRDAGVEGLPVGPAASAVLAEAVLCAGDHAIRATGVAHVRWVDDIAIFAPDATTRAGALDALRRAWSALGLELHDGKTVLLDDHASAGMHAWGKSNSAAAPATLR
jgi:Reverse transcriptase (RNA-dependent DNA polymerase)